MRRRHTFAQSLVEFALVLPLLASLLIGLADFGFLFYGHVQVANAAREGARAGSLYLGSRFYYTNTTDCWSLRQWVENALVEHNRDNQNCPAASFNTAVHAFGLLNPQQCATAADTSCWVLDVPSTVVAGNQLDVHLTYRFNVLFLGGLGGFVQNPVLIDKHVIMKVENN